MKKMFKALLFPIWLVLEVVVFVLKLVMVLSSTVLGILLRILIPMAFVAMLLSVRNGLMLLAFAWLISPIGLPWVADRVVFLEDGLVVETATPEVFFHHPETERAQAFLKSFVYDSKKREKGLDKP